MANHTYTRTFTAAQWRAFEHDLLDPFAWIDAAIDGKLAASQGRMATDAVAVLTADPAVTDIPAKPEKLIAELVKRGDYRNRKQRDDEERAAEKARHDAASAAIKAQEERDEAERKAFEQKMKEAAEAGDVKRKAAAEEAERKLQERIDEAVAKALGEKK